MPRVERFDFGARLRADKMTEQGGAKVGARLSRIGVQEYHDGTGKVIREYRPPEQVFDEKSLATFITSTVTDGHPEEVTPQNWKALAVGFVLNPHRDGRYVAADLVIQDAATLKKIDAGDLVEISCGYSTDLVMQSGTSPDGERYDAVQTALRINHVALGPSSWGRAGPAVKLQLDSLRERGASVAVWSFDEKQPARNALENDEALALAVALHWPIR